jgi:hypothetical protein
MKREIPILLTVLSGLAIIWSFFSSYPVADAANTELLQWALIFFSVAFILGIANLVRVSLKQISSGHSDSIYKIVLLVVLFGYLFIGLAEHHEWFGASSLGGEGSVTVKDWVYSKMFIPLQATMFSLLAFFIASATFRAFRARSLESTLLLVAGTIVMLGQVPLGEEITGGYAPRWLGFLMVYINAAGQKAIIIGATLGVLATGLRIVLGIERSYLSE